MNRKQRKALLERRRHPERYRRAPTAAEVAFEEVSALAKRQKKGKTYIALKMQSRGFLPNGTNGWREMTDKEIEMWRATP